MSNTLINLHDVVAVSVGEPIVKNLTGDYKYSRRRITITHAGGDETAIVLFSDIPSVDAPVEVENEITP